MRVVLQRVTRASVDVDGREVGAIGRGLVALVGVARGDGPQAAADLADRTAQMRLFADEAGRFERSAAETAAEVLVVSQFTLLGDTRKGRRPNFTEAAPAAVAAPLVALYAERLRQVGLRVAEGRFGAHMLVRLENDGPVTILLESRS
ncbi:MAG: D-tyrosyl-tRNA(Tyr) deacylase [Chloroflexi bacterium]|nr:D-tyrosyl-tRNA(Tyr) deacylase [Chloroflexota bacterium]